MGKVTGIGGVFFKAKDPQKLVAWYKNYLGFHLEESGLTIFQWQEDKAPDNGITIWHTAKHDTEWFSPSRSSFMINYRVDDLDSILANMTENGADIHQGPEVHENGKFAWVLDPEGNKVELWEPKNWEAFS